MNAPALSALTAPADSRSVIHKNGLWYAIAVVAAIDAIWLYCSGLSLSLGPATPLGFAALIGLGLAYTSVRQNIRIASFAIACAELAAFNLAAIVLSYLAASARFPLVDNILSATDAALGFDWLALFNWAKLQHPTIGWTLDLVYDTLIIQVLVLLVVLNATGKLQRARAFNRLFATTLVMIIPLSMLLPAEGAWAHYGVSHLTSAYYLPDFYAIRSGAMRIIDLGHLTGIIQFPSFHAALGLILIVSTRGTFLFPVYLPLNVLMIVSALTAGGHYLSDVIVGLATVPAAMFWLSASGAGKKAARPQAHTLSREGAPT